MGVVLNARLGVLKLLPGSFTGLFGFSRSFFARASANDREPLLHLRQAVRKFARPVDGPAYCRTNCLGGFTELGCGLAGDLAQRPRVRVLTSSKRSGRPASMPIAPLSSRSASDVPSCAFSTLSGTTGSDDIELPSPLN